SNATTLPSSVCRGAFPVALVGQLHRSANEPRNVPIFTALAAVTSSSPDGTAFKPGEGVATCNVIYLASKARLQPNTQV
ncbi:unnamed protein product, partial [Ectocarpus sp. 12 AP-2014]